MIINKHKPALTEAKKRRRRKKLPYNSISYTTGDIALNINRFNQAMGTDFGQGNADGEAVDAGEVGNALCEGKRYVRRYYIRPQNIFCSNKAEILKTLIELDDANCSVYTLNNLGDNKDVSKLMNSDIIYYYDNGILYDKNRVKVMDYDLSIKKEENRKHFTNVDKASDKDFKNAYEDRMTDATELEESGNKPLPFTVEELETALKSTNWEIFIGYNHQDSEVQTVGGSPYSNTNWYVEKNDNKYLLTSVLISDDGGEYTNKTKAYESIEELYKAIQQLESLNDVPQLTFTEKEYFNQDFDSYNVFGERLTEARENFCCICGEPIEGYGNNPEPFRSAEDGVACDGCNLKFVIPSRLDIMEV